MVIATEFQYLKPLTLADATAAIAKYNTEAKLLAGGTDLIVYLKEDIVAPKYVIDIKAIPELHKLAIEPNGKLFIGAAVTFSELIHSEIIEQEFPVIADSAKTVASCGVRNRATLVGNICSAIPSLDSAPPLLVYDADVLVQSEQGQRIISIHDWFLAPRKTALKNNEIVVGVYVQKPSQKHAACYVKLGRYLGEDLAQSALCIMVLENMQYKVAYCAVGPVPKRGKKVEDILNGNPLTEAIIAKAMEVVPEEISPITDIRATKEYRTHMTKIMLQRGLLSAQDCLLGKKPRCNPIVGAK